MDIDNNLEKQEALKQLRRELESLQSTTADAIAAIDLDKLHRLPQFNPGNLAIIQRLINEVMVRSRFQ